MSDEQYQVHRFARNLARRLAKLERANRKTARASADLRNSAIDGGKGLTLKDADGNVSYRLGTDSNGVTAPEYVGGPVPSQPAAPFVDAGQRVVKVQLSGLDADEDPAPTDFWRAEIHVSLDDDFEPSLSTLATYIDEPNGSATHSLPAGEWYVGVVWVTLSKQRSVMSDLVVADIEPPVDAEEIEADLEDARQRIQDARDYADQQFEAFDERVESAETDLNDAHDRIDAAEGALSTTQSDLDDAKADITAVQSAADKAIADALAAANLAEGKGQVITQVSAPTGSRARAENLWVRLPDMKVHYYDGDKWKPVLDPDTIAAAQQAANALTKANDLQTKHDALQLAVDGEGGLKDRLSTAENTLEDKAASSDLQELDDILRGTEDLPPQIADRFYAAMAIVEKLQAVSGWVGGVNLADGAVTAEKIEATREMITKIMGAEWAYIAEQLVVDGDLIANNADIISAVIKNLDVTEQSNFVDAFAEQLRTKEFTALVATMARAIIAAPNLYPALDDPDMPEVLDKSSAVTVVDSSRSRTGKALEFKPGNGNMFAKGPVFDIEPGEELHLEAKYGRIGDTRNEGGIWYLGIYRLNDNGSISGYGPYVGATPQRISKADWDTEISGTVKIGEDETARKAQVLIRFDDSQATPLSNAHTTVYDIKAQRALDGHMLIDGTVDTRHLNVTEEMVASFARILHLVVDQIDVNSLWADTTWQNAGHFGSTDGDYQTRVDGTGLQTVLYDAESELETVMLRIGALFGLIFADENGQITGSLSHEGDASLRDVSMESLTIRGRQLLPAGDPAEYWDGNLWDSQPKGLICYHEEDMSGVNVNYQEYGFIEVSHHVKANRKYRVTIDNIRLSGSGTYYGKFRYTLGTNPEAPHTESPRLSDSWFIRNTETAGVGVGGHHIFTPETDGLIRILFTIEAGSPGIRFNSNTEYNNIQMSLEDLGPNRFYTGMGRAAGHGGSATVRDPKPLTGGITTEWDMTWYQNYSHNGTRRRSSSNNSGGYGAAGLTQGVRQDATSDGQWNSLFGFTTSTASTDPNDEGVSLAAALQGTEILAMHIEVQHHFAFSNASHGYFGFGWHSHATSPNQYGGTTGFAFDQRLQVGTVSRIPLPIDAVEHAARNGDLRGFSIATGSTTAVYAGQLSWHNRPKLIVTYTR